MCVFFFFARLIFFASLFFARGFVFFLANSFVCFSKMGFVFLFCKRFCFSFFCNVFLFFLQGFCLFARSFGLFLQRGFVLFVVDGFFFSFCHGFVPLCQFFFFCSICFLQGVLFCVQGVLFIFIFFTSGSVVI